MKRVSKRMLMMPIVEQVLRQHVTKPVVMLDLCAAPGGKSTHARSVLPEGSLLVANEVIRNRSQILAENLTKWGHPDVVVTNNDPADFSALPSFFDVILTDVIRWPLKNGVRRMWKFAGNGNGGLLRTFGRV